MTGTGWTSTNPDRWFISEVGGGGLIYVSNWSTGPTNSGVETIRLLYSLTYDVVTPDVGQNINLAVDQSVFDWGPRTLEFPPWFAATAGDAVQARIDDLAQPRSIFPVTFAVSQPDAQRTADVAAIEPGDYIGLSIDDPATRVSINATAYVMTAKYTLTRNREIAKHLICLQSVGGAVHLAIPFEVNSIPLTINAIPLEASG